MLSAGLAAVAAQGPQYAGKCLTAADIAAIKKSARDVAAEIAKHQGEALVLFMGNSPA